MTRKKRKGRSAAFMRSINPHLNHTHKRGTKKMARKKRRAARHKGFSSSIWTTIVGTGGYIVFESLVEPYIQGYVGAALPFVELGLGMAFARKGGVVGNVAKAAIAINTYKLMSVYVRPMVSSIATP